MRSASFISVLLALLSWAGAVRAGGTAAADPVSRTEALEIAKSYAEHHWQATARNVLHGPDHGHVLVDTPDRGAPGGQANPSLWSIDGENVGVPYKWGGFDTLATFDAGVKAGKAAGDLYTADKRKKGGDAVSSEAVGVDCSGFISRCWKLKQKRGTSTLEDLCEKLGSPAELLPADIMNASEGHVVLFAKWLDEARTRALFYESEPYSKVISSEREIAELVSDGFRPLRYRQIHD